MARFVKHKAIVFFPDNIAFDVDERIEQPVVRIDQIHAGGSFTDVVIEVLDGDRGICTRKGKVAVDCERTLTISNYVAEIAEINTASTTVNDKIIEFTSAIDSNPPVLLELKSRPKEDSIQIGVRIGNTIEIL